MDPIWWNKLCAYAKEQGVWPTHILKQAADREMLQADMIKEPTEHKILAAHDRHNA